MKLSALLKKYNIVPDPEIKEVVSTIDKNGHGVLLLEIGDLNPQELGDVSLCDGCHCMTYTIKGKCGKCGGKK